MTSVLLALAGCAEERELPRPPPFDAGPVDSSRPDLGSTDASRDLGTPSDSSTDLGFDAFDPGATDAATDAGFSGCGVNAERVVVRSTTTNRFSPSAAARASDFAVVYLDVVAGATDVFTRRVPATGALGLAFPLTMDTVDESAPTLVASGLDYVVAFERATFAGQDLATIGFDAASGDSFGINDITLDLEADTRPLLGPTLNGLLLFFERSDGTTQLRRIGLSDNGSPLDAVAPVGSTRFPVGAVAFDGTSTDRRLFHAQDATTVASFRVDADGLEDAVPDGYTVGLPGSAVLTRVVGVTATDASPRGALVASSVVGRASAHLLRVDPGGAFLGTPREIDDVRTVSAASLSAYGAAYVVAYRASEGADARLRLRVFDTALSLVTDVSVLPLDDAAGDVQVVALGDGSGLFVVYDDASGSARELRVVDVGCLIP